MRMKPPSGPKKQTQTNPISNGSLTHWQGKADFILWY
jgi:hypothetical protein